MQKVRNVTPVLYNQSPAKGIVAVLIKYFRLDKQKIACYYSSFGI